MINNHPNKIISISGFSFLTKIHDENFAAVNMNNNLQIYLGKKPFNCLYKKQLTKGTEIYNLKEIFIQNKYIKELKEDSIIDKNKIYLLLYEKDLLIYCFENGYKKCVIIQKISNGFYIGPLIQLSNKDILFFDKKNLLKIMKYKNDNKFIFKNELILPKKDNNFFILSFLELEQNQIITTSTSRHPKGEDVIRIYEIIYNSNNSKLINNKNFGGYYCSLFENNMCKLSNKKTICININYYKKKNILINRDAIILLNYEYLEITTIIEIENSIFTIFNFYKISNDFNNKSIYEYILISKNTQNKNDESKTKNKSNEKNRFIDFYVFEPSFEYEPLLMEKNRIVTNNQIDITNSFLLNGKYLVIFQTSQISIYEI